MMVDLAGNVLWRKQPHDESLAEGALSLLVPNYGHPSSTGGVALAAPLALGDLAVLRLHDAELKSFRVLREDYADLVLGPTTTDDRGTFYLVTLAGGRRQEEQRPLLCGIPGSGTPACRAIPTAPHHVLGTRANGVYALSSNALSRFDFPAP